jgi:hypothetical protein
LYPLAVSAPSAFNDITVGNNSSPCVFQSFGCLDGNTTGFDAGLGYDRASGLGTIDAANLVHSWSLAAPAAAGSAPVLTSISPTSIAAGSNDFTLTAAGNNFPLNAQILWNGSTAGVTMLPGGTSTSIKANISAALVAYGTSTAGIPGAQAPFNSTFVSVTQDSPNPLTSANRLPFTVTSLPPPNDNIATAIVITSSNYSGVVDNSSATSEPTDPVPPCASSSANPDTKTVWWSFTAIANANVTLSTIGSSYDTTLSVWTGAPGNLSNVACNDDASASGFANSELTLTTTAGAAYYILVAPFGPSLGSSPVAASGGKTVLNVTHAPLAPAAPVFTSPNSATYVVGLEGKFFFTATGSPAPTFSESGALPGGVLLNSVTGALFGFPGQQSEGVYSIAVTASNGVGPPAIQNFRLTSGQLAAIESPTSATFNVGDEGFFLLSIAGFPSPTLSEFGALPPGESFDPAAQNLDGILPPGSGGIYHLTFTAHNGLGPDAVQPFTLTVIEPPGITSSFSAAFPLNTFGSFRVTGSGFPLPAISESGALPLGVSFDAATGVLSGAPAAGSAASYAITFTAGNGVDPAASQNFTLFIGVPALDSLPTSQTIAAGDSATFMIANPGASMAALACSGLPAGASCAPVTVPASSSAALVISTSARAAGIPAARRGTLWRIDPWLCLAIVLLFAREIFAAARKRPRIARVSLGSVVLLLLFTAAGCGFTGSAPKADPAGTPAGTYTITVTGSAAGIPAQPVSITLIVT